MQKILFLIAVFGFVAVANAQDTIELETTTIKGNTELPKYLYVVPWQDKEADRDKERKVRLHNLYGDLFDPVMPDSQSFTTPDVNSQRNQIIIN